MSLLRAENISVTFPLYSKAQMSAAGVQTEHDSRIITSPSGRIRAVTALSHISLNLRSGDRLAIIGRNGAGKTTLLQVLAGIIPPDTGRIVRQGAATSVININLGMQPEASGHRNITLRGLAAGRTRAEIEEKRSDIQAFSELGEFLDMPVNTYSAGMRMRLTFAIATAFEPDILILDEWLSAGDASFRNKATERMNTFVSKAGILVLASHSRKLLTDNCNRAIWLEDGVIRAEGGVEPLLDEYESEHQARPPRSDKL